jgi:hypothetical protein
MKIVKFNETYKYGYRGKGLISNRNEVISEIIDIFQDSNFLGYEIIMTEYHGNDESLYLIIDKKDNYGKYENSGNCIKLDLSGMGIEIGKKYWNEEKEEMDEFIPEINIDSSTATTAKNIKKYNI